MDKKTGSVSQDAKEGENNRKLIKKVGLLKGGEVVY
jgi:hypothetical protein